MSLLRIMSHVALAMLSLPGLPVHKVSWAAVADERCMVVAVNSCTCMLQLSCRLNMHRLLR